MTILLVGGGSGGHITPLLAVANQLKTDHPKVKIAIISEKRGKFNHLFDGAGNIDEIYFINAGKYRRYYGEHLFSKILDFKSLLLNIRDMFRLFVGLVESLYLIIKIKPNIVFVKGGYVGVPVGFACRLLRIPYVTHDSDAVPGLTNRLIAKKAVLNTVGMPPEFYPYKREKTVFVGVPVTEDYLDPSRSARKLRRGELYVDKDDFLLLITGGSNGAQRLDRAVHRALFKLLIKYPRLRVIHQVGRGNEKIYEDYMIKLHSRIRVADFLKPLSTYISASDLVIARAGATAIAEVGHLKKPLIVIPNHYLSGGHQTKNAEVLTNAGAALIVNEAEALEKADILARAIEKLIKSEELRRTLSENLHKLVQKDASQKISQLLIELAHKHKR